MNVKIIKIGISSFVVLFTLVLAIIFGYQYNDVEKSVEETSITFSLQEVAKHNTVEDCWMIIDNKVYDVDSYIQKHPGGASRIIKNCGKDGTTDFNTKDGSGSDHSSNAKSLLQDYYIGELD